MINWLKGWKGMAVGTVFIALSILYNSLFKAQIANSIPLQIPGYFLIGLGCALVMYAALSSPDPKKNTAESLDSSKETVDESAAAEEETAHTPSEEDSE